MPKHNYIPRISFVAGIVNPGDAISETLIADISALDQMSSRQRRNLDLQVYCRESSYSDARVQVVNDWRDVLHDEHFMTSDLYYFHFGIFSEMHHLMLYIRRDARLVVFFHNVTQPQYCRIEDENLIHRSYQQIRNFVVADFVFTASRFSAQQITGYGLGRDIKILPLFGPNAAKAISRQPPSIDPTRPLRLLYCGRFVRSKGVDVLLAALDRIKTSLARPVELTLAGQTQFSDSDYLAWLEQKANGVKPGVTVTFAPDLGSEAICPLFANADAFVLPSLHEGFGMTVAEALVAGTPVICSDAGALPEVSGGYGLTFRSGDMAGLATALQGFVTAQAAGTILCDRGALPPAQWHHQMSGHAQTFLRAHYLERMIDVFDALLQPTASWSVSARQALAEAELFEPGDTLADRLDQVVDGAVAAEHPAPSAIIDHHGNHRPALSARLGHGAQTRHTPTRSLAVDTWCADLHIADRRRRLHWLGPAHGWMRRALRQLHELAGKRAYVIGRTRALIARGNAARDRKDWPEAIKSYTRALEICPAIGSIWVQLGHVLKESGALSDADMAYKRAVTYLPLNSDIHLKIGHLYKLRGQGDEAIYYYSLALFYDPDNFHALRELKNLGHGTIASRIKAFLGKP